MTETSTLERASNLGIEEELVSLFEEKATSENKRIMGPPNRPPNVLFDSQRRQTIPDASWPHTVILNHRVTDEQLLPVTRIAEHIGAFSDLWNQISSKWMSFERTLTEGSNYGHDWRHSYAPGLQGNGLSWEFVHHDGDSTNAELAEVLNDLNSGIVQEWTAIVHDPTKPLDVGIGNRAQERLTAKLQASFEDSPLEDGMGHPAEEIIAEELRSTKDQQVPDWLKVLSTDASRPSFAASVLRCLGRQDRVGTTSWRVELVRDGLASDNVEIRDAAVQAAESWGDSDSLDVLRAHSEPEPWLQQYIRDVIEDLTE